MQPWWPRSVELGSPSERSRDPAPATLLDDPWAWGVSPPGAPSQLVRNCVTRAPTRPGSSYHTMCPPPSTNSSSPRGMRPTNRRQMSTDPTGSAVPYTMSVGCAIPATSAFLEHEARHEASATDDAPDHVALVPSPV